MLPRPQLRDNFHLTYRKIPVLAIDRDLYCDSSLITEALEHLFPDSPSLYPPTADGRNYRPLIRGFASYWTDRPLFRITCGLMPASIWRSQFGVDRAQLIGHTLDADKLERKLPENLTKLDQQLSMLNPLFEHPGSSWIFSTPRPSLADISVYYELLWGSEIASGRMTEHITQGDARPAREKEPELEGTTPIFNRQRYPALCAWYERMREYFDALPDVENRETSLREILAKMHAAPISEEILLPTPTATMPELDERVGLQKGAVVSVVPDDTGRDDPTVGTLVALSPEEVVIEPRELERPATVKCRVHFPRLGFVVRPVGRSKL